MRGSQLKIVTDYHKESPTCFVEKVVNTLGQVGRCSVTLDDYENINEMVQKGLKFYNSDELLEKQKPKKVTKNSAAIEEHNNSSIDMRLTQNKSPLCLSNQVDQLGIKWCMKALLSS